MFVALLSWAAWQLDRRVFKKGNSVQVGVGGLEERPRLLGGAVVAVVYTRSVGSVD